MIDSAAKSKRSGLATAVIVTFALTILSVGRIANPANSYPGRDGGIFLYIGSLLLKGARPYVDAWENKGPLVFYLNAFGLWLGGGSRWGVWLVEVVFLAAAFALLYFTLRAIMGDVPASGGVLLGTLAAGSLLQGGNYSEEYSLLFTVAALWAYLRCLEMPNDRLPLVLVGCTLGLNLLLRPNLVAMQAAILIAFVVTAMRSGNWGLLLRKLAWTAVGLLVILIPALAYLAARGALSEMLRVVLVFNFQYSEGFSLVELSNGARGVIRAVGRIPVALALSGDALALYSLWRARSNPGHRSAFLLVPVIGWTVEVVLSTLSGRSYLHYFISWAPYLAIFAAVLIAQLMRPFERLGSRYAGPLVLALALIALTFARPWAAYGDTVSTLLRTGRRPPAFRDPVALYVEATTGPADRVFVWGFRPIVNFASGRDAPVSFLPYPLVHVDSPLGRAWADQFYAELTADPPILLVNMIEPDDRERLPDLDRIVRREQTIKRGQVVLAHNLPETLNWIEAHYTLAGRVDGHDVYRLNQAVP